MDIRIYDLNLDNDAAVVVTGDTSDIELNRMYAFMRMIKTILPDNPVVFVPEELTAETMTREELISMFADAFSEDDLRFIENVALEASVLSHNRKESGE